LWPERGEVFEEHEVGEAAWGYAAEVVIQVEVGCGVEGRHLDGLYRRDASFHGQPEETVEVAVFRYGVRHGSVGGEEDPARADVFLRDHAQ
jgi:hypothetical protein